MMQNTEFFHMDANDIDTYSPGAVVNFQCSDSSVVSAKILGPWERGAVYWSITYEPQYGGNA